MHYKQAAGKSTKQQLPTRSDPIQIVLIRACLYGRGACAVSLR